MFFTFLVTSSHIYVIAAAICGFMFIGLILAAGLCELSWRHEKHEHLDFYHSLSRLRQCQNTLCRFAGVLLGFSIVWFALSALILSLTLGIVAPSIERSLWGEFSELVTNQPILHGGLGKPNHPAFFTWLINTFVWNDYDFPTARSRHLVCLSGLSQR